MLKELKSMETRLDESIKGIYSSASSAEDIDSTVDDLWKILSGLLIYYQGLKARLMIF